MTIRLLRDSLQTPRAVLSFSGWPDAGKVVEFTLAHMHKLIPHDPVAIWDLDGFWHTEATRPEIRLQHGQVQSLDWPSYQFFITTAGHSAEGILLGRGPEPSLSWRSFAKELVGSLLEWGCREVFLLGCLFDQVFHDEILISAVVQDPQSYNRVRELRCQLVEYNGPSAIHSAIMAEAKVSGISCISFWAHLPSYLNGPHELITSEFLRILGSVLGMNLPSDDLIQLWQEKEKQIERLVSQDQGLRQTLESIKKQKVTRRSDLSSKVVRFEDFLKKRSDLDPDKE